jgi:hypothetical protein
MIEYVRWRARLWLVGWRERIEHQSRMATLSSADRWPPTGRYTDFVNRVSPFTPNGYKRRRLRRLLWLLRNPRRMLRRDLLWILRGLVVRFAPWVGPGRFECMDYRTRLKAEFLVDNPDLILDETGDTEFFGLFAMLYDLDPPWSREPEVWLVTIDQQGFIYATEYSSLNFADQAFREIKQDFERSTEPFPEDVMQQERDDLYESQIDRYGR